MVGSTHYNVSAAEPLLSHDARPLEAKVTMSELRARTQMRTQDVLFISLF
jgi:hypothetical protein